MTKNELKLLLRTGSLRFALHRERAGGPAETIQWNGHALHYRPGTSDPALINSILLKKDRKAEYWIPKPIYPATIFDIGANIGAAALYFAKRYPNAKVYSFEPVPSNFEMLSRNVEPYGNIRAFNVALGAVDGSVELIESPGKDNFGGFSVYQRGADADCRKFMVPCRSLASMLGELAVGTPDLIKIDTEGAESMILRSLPQEVISRVQWIVGELHGEDDFELLAYLSTWFEIGMRKSVNGPLFNFHARNRQLVNV